MTRCESLNLYSCTITSGSHLCSKPCRLLRLVTTTPLILSLTNQAAFCVIQKLSEGNKPIRHYHIPPRQLFLHKKQAPSPKSKLTCQVISSQPKRIRSLRNPIIAVPRLGMACRTAQIVSTIEEKMAHAVIMSVHDNTAMFLYDGDKRSEFGLVVCGRDIGMAKL